ncbi:MAG: hypothetical protein KQI35_00885 [Bacteroidetes bacterium]|nr:hypothetical protein [Bacteroidota bacterium]
MKLSVIKQAFLALFAISMLISCEYEFIEVATPKPPDPNDTTVETVLFSTQIEPIFSASNCTNCHGGGSPSAGLNLSAGNAYNSIISNDLVTPGDPEASIIYTYPNPISGSHNTRYGSADDANLIYLWIFQGAMDN